jgi:polar amino acid transport system substrate-binding protein
MNGHACAFMLAAALLAPAAATAQPSTDPRVADIVRAGKVRIGMHLPQFVQDPKTGEIHGHGTGTVIVQVAQALADRLGVKLELVGHPSPPALVKCLQAGACDVGFLGYTPHRIGDVDYAQPHIIVPFTYLVPAGSPIRRVADADKAGVRIAVVRNHTSTIALTSLLKHAKMVAVEIPDEAFNLLREGNVDAYASPRPPILEYSDRLPGSRVLDDHYGANIQAMAVAKRQAARLAYINDFVEQARTSGAIQQAIIRVGERGIEVAPSEILTGTTPSTERR